MAKANSAGAQSGISLFAAVGVAVAVQISWSMNQSVGWAIFHGLLNWVYVVFRVIVGTTPAG